MVQIIVLDETSGLECGCRRCGHCRDGRIDRGSAPAASDGLSYRQCPSVMMVSYSQNAHRSRGCFEAGCQRQSARITQRLDSSAPSAGERKVAHHRYHALLIGYSSRSYYSKRRQSKTHFATGAGEADVRNAMRRNTPSICHDQMVSVCVAEERSPSLRIRINLSNVTPGPIISFVRGFVLSTPGCLPPMS
jgi:hypothetical protein